MAKMKRVWPLPWLLRRFNAEISIESERIRAVEMKTMQNGQTCGKAGVIIRGAANYGRVIHREGYVAVIGLLPIIIQIRGYAESSRKQIHVS